MLYRAAEVATSKRMSRMEARRAASGGTNTDVAAMTAVIAEVRGALLPDGANGQAGREKGPRVWLDMDQKELDDAYDQAVYAPNRDHILARNAHNSELVRRRLGAPRRLAYGTSAIEGVDVFTTTAADAPVAVYVHGGAWRQRFAREYAFAAEMFVDAGAHYAILDFPGIDETGGDLMAMADHVRRGLAWVARNTRAFGGDPERLYLIGHSSGAHLAGVLLTTDWQGSFGLDPAFIKGGVCCSGMYDLEPVRRSKRSAYVKFTDEIVQELSGQRHLDRLTAPVTVLYGTCETPEFQRQSLDFAAAIRGAGKPVELVVSEGYNHFEINESLGNPYGVFGRAVLERMGLAKR
jgi:arylformamidase